VLWEIVVQKPGEIDAVLVGFLFLIRAATRTAKIWDSADYNGFSLVGTSMTNIAMKLVLHLHCSGFIFQNVMVLAFYMGILLEKTNGDYFEMMPLICTAVMLCFSRSKQEYLAREAFFRQQVSAQNVFTNTISHGTLNQTASGPSDGTLQSQSSLPDTSQRGQVIRKDNSDAGTTREQRKNIAEIGQHEHRLVDSKELTLDNNQVLGAGTFGVVVKNGNQRVGNSMNLQSLVPLATKGWQTPL